MIKLFVTYLLVSLLYVPHLLGPLQSRRRFVLTRLSRQAGRPVDQMTTVLDLSGMGMKHMTSEALTYTRRIGDIFHDNYSGMTTSLLVVNTPWIFSKGWQMIEGLDIVPLPSLCLRFQLEGVKGITLPDTCRRTGFEYVSLKHTTVRATADDFRCWLLARSTSLAQSAPYFFI